jgi:hypothetical protein
MPFKIYRKGQPNARTMFGRLQVDHGQTAVGRGVVRLRAFWTRTEGEFTLRLVVHYFKQNRDPARSSALVDLRLRR